MCHFHFYFSHLENIIFLTNFKIFEDIDWSGVIEPRAQAQLLTSLGFEVRKIGLVGVRAQKPWVLGKFKKKYNEKNRKNK